MMKKSVNFNNNDQKQDNNNNADINHNTNLGIMRGSSSNMSQSRHTDSDGETRFGKSDTTHPPNSYNSNKNKNDQEQQHQQRAVAGTNMDISDSDDREANINNHPASPNKKRTASFTLGGGSGGGAVINDNHTVETQETGFSDASGDDSLDNDFDQQDGMNSSISGTSGSSLGSKSLKSTIPCGMNMPVLMTLAVMVPIIFLVVYTAIPLSKSIAADAFLSEHRPVFIGIRNVGGINLFERLNATFVITLPESDPEYANYSRDMMISRRDFDAEVLKFTELMRESDLDDRVNFMRDLDQVMRDIDVDREKIDSKTARPRDYRDRQIELINRVTRLLLYFAHDNRVTANRVRISLYVLVRRSQNLFSATLGSAVGILNSGNDTDLYADNVRALRSAFDSVTSDIEYIIRASDKTVADEMRSVRDSKTINRWFDTCRLLLQRNRTKYASLTSANLTSWFNTAFAEFDSTDHHFLRRITNSELLAAIALESSLMMTFALLGCCLSLAVVIYYNNKEQKRMERALDSTAVLANAVQRFVPKNQLKTMGVRSITQVQPGMTTEVAQTITFSDIREFTRLSESMSRLELFEWLQNYVSRMTKVVSEEKSYIMAFLGDGLGICSPQPTYAVNAAIKMHVAVEALNLDIVAKGGTLPIQIGVGIHHGVVVAGVFGDENRLSCTMIASDVNFASRLEALTKSFGVKILASDDVICQISSDVFSFRNVGKVQVKGSSKAVKVFDIYQVDALKMKKFKDATKEAFEGGIKLIDVDPPRADKIFEQIALQARMEGLHDAAAEMHSRRRRGKNPMDRSSSACGSVLSFEKDGELKNDLGAGLHTKENSNAHNSGFFDDSALTVNSAPGSPDGRSYLNSSPLKKGNRCRANSFTSHPQQQQQQQQPKLRKESSFLENHEEGSFPSGGNISSRMQSLDIVMQDGGSNSLYPTIDSIVGRLPQLQNNNIKPPITNTACKAQGQHRPHQYHGEDDKEETEGIGSRHLSSNVSNGTTSDLRTSVAKSQNNLSDAGLFSDSAATSQRTATAATTGSSKKAVAPPLQQQQFAPLPHHHHQAKNTDESQQHQTYRHHHNGNNNKLANDHLVVEDDDHDAAQEEDEEDLVEETATLTLYAREQHQKQQKQGKQQQQGNHQSSPHRRRLRPSTRKSLDSGDVDFVYKEYVKKNPQQHQQEPIHTTNNNMLFPSSATTEGDREEEEETLGTISSSAGGAAGGSVIRETSLGSALYGSRDKTMPPNSSVRVDQSPNQD